MKRRRRTHYLIQPKGSEHWIETTKQGVEALKRSHGPERVTLDRRETELSITVFVEIVTD